MIEINLVPDVKQELIRAQRTRAVVVSFSIVIGLAALGVVVLLALYVFGFQTVRHSLADNAIDEHSKELSSIEDLSKVLTIQNQLEKLETQAGEKKLESRIFDVLSAVLPPAPNQVLIETMSIDAETSNLSISGQTPTYDTLEVFKKTIDGAEVTYTEQGAEQSAKLAEDISISDVSYGEGSDGNKVLRFNISFTYPEPLFLASVSNTVIKLTNTGNATDSYLGVPRSIFVTQGGAN